MESDPTGVSFPASIKIRDASRMLKATVKNSYSITVRQKEMGQFEMPASREEPGDAFFCSGWPLIGMHGNTFISVPASCLTEDRN